MKKSMRMRWISLLAAASLAAAPAPVAAAKAETASSSSEADSNLTKAGHPKKITFRGLKWGSTLEEVEASDVLDGMTEGTDYVYDDDDKCLYITGLSVAGKNTNTMLYFNADGQFCMGAYILDEKHANSQNDYLDFRDIETELTKKYGEPTKNNDDWTDDFYKGQEDRYGMAIALGELSLVRGWRARDSSRIAISCRGDNADISTVIMYYAPISIHQQPEKDEDDGL